MFHLCSTIFILVSFVTIGFSAPNVGRRTVIEIVDDIEAISQQLASYNATLYAYPRLGGSADQFMAVHTSVVGLESALSEGATDIISNGHLSESDGSIVLGLVQQLEPTILSALQEFLVKKAGLMSFTSPTVAPTAMGDLANLNTTMTAFENALILELPVDLQSQATTIKNNNDAAFLRAITLFPPA